MFSRFLRIGTRTWHSGTQPLVVLLLLGYCGGAMADAPDTSAPVISHFVPADKQLPRGWVQSLFEKGGTRACRGKELDLIGMPIGGITAGQLYLCGDGTLGCWQLFNRDYFSGYGRDNYHGRRPTHPVDQGFAVRVGGDRGPRVFRLNRQDFADVELIGEYPIGRVTYRDPECPLRVELEAFSPFIPLNAADSALPATILNITLRNPSDRPVVAEAVAWLENAVCFDNASYVRGRRRTRILQDRNRTYIVHAVQPFPPDELPDVRPPLVLADFEGRTYGEWKAEGQAFGDGSARGALPHQQPVTGFLGEGLVNSFHGGDESTGSLTSPLFTVSRRFINFCLGGGQHPEQACINLVVDGQVVRSSTGRNREQLEWESWNVEDLEGREARIEIVDRATGAWGHINVDHIELADQPRGGPTGPLEKFPDYGMFALALAEGEAQGSARWGNDPVPPKPPVGIPPLTDQAYPARERGWGEITTAPLHLGPGEQQTLTFVLAWHFPNLGSHGRHYARRFSDAVAIVNHILDHRDRLVDQTRLWHETFYDSTLPHWLLDRIGSTLGNLATGTCYWWANGQFWAWEGVGCCEGTCTHVWNYAHALARLFPELERSARTFQDLDQALCDDGLVGFRGRCSKNAHAADGQAGTVLKCYREHQMSADDAFLRKAWPRIRRVLEYAIQHDGNDDGLIEASQHNTYDINFEGANTFVGSLYLAALRAGEEMAREVGDDEFAARTRAIFESGRRLTMERLFNGEYFIQDVDLEQHPKFQYGPGCLSDQVFGQGWAHQLGLGYLYPPDPVRKALESVWRYNWAPDVGPHNAAHPPERGFAFPGEAGLFICTWPKSAYLAEGVRYREEVWTGIEYQVAGHMIWEGMVPEALAIVRAVHDRYHPLKRNPYNEVECGDHYARALASWGVLTALAGYEYHGPRGHLGFNPRLTPHDFRSVFTAADGWGTFTQRRDDAGQHNRIDVRWGRLRLKSLVLNVPRTDHADAPQVRIGREPVALRTETLPDARTQILFEPEVVVRPDQPLQITFAR